VRFLLSVFLALILYGISIQANTVNKHELSTLTGTGNLFPLHGLELAVLRMVDQTSSVTCCYLPSYILGDEGIYEHI